MNASERKNMWAERIDRCLSSDMTIKEWCELNHVGQSALYKWMAEFRESEPGRFPRRSSIASKWIEVTRDGISDAKAIVPTATSVGSTPMRATSPDQRFPDCPKNTALPISVFTGGIELVIPAGTAETDIARAMRAAMSL